ncbi:MAG: DUF503 domain-containing protein [Bacillota bacterium]
MRLFIGSLEVIITIPCNESLKGKRRVVKSLLDRIRHRYNVGVAEVGYLDSYSLSALGVATVSSDKQLLQQVLEDVLKWIEHNHDGDVASYNIRIV